MTQHMQTVLSHINSFSNTSEDQICFCEQTLKNRMRHKSTDTLHSDDLSDVFSAEHHHRLLLHNHHLLRLYGLHHVTAVHLMLYIWHVFDIRTLQHTWALMVWELLWGHTWLFKPVERSQIKLMNITCWEQTQINFKRWFSFCSISFCLCNLSYINLLPLFPFIWHHQTFILTPHHN